MLAIFLALVGCVAGVSIPHYQHALQHDVVQQKKPHIPIVKQDYQQSKEGYQFSYETGNGIHVQETGQIKNLGDKKHETIVKQGSVTYHDEHGQPITLTYVADENGFQPKGAHLPTPPPIPHEILKSLQQHHQHQPQPQQPQQPQQLHTNVLFAHQNQQHLLQQTIGDEEYDQQQYEYI